MERWNAPLFAMTALQIDILGLPQRKVDNPRYGEGILLI
jgi:hypothetical protein